MAIPQQIASYFKQSACKYIAQAHAPTSTLEETADLIRMQRNQVLRAVLLTDGKQRYMAVLPVDHILDFKAMLDEFGRNFYVEPSSEMQSLFPTCEQGSIPPLGKPFDLPMLIDRSITELAEVIFEPGSHSIVIRMRGIDYTRLVANERFGRFSYPISQHEQRNDQRQPVDRPSEIKRRIEQIYDLPAIPDMAMRILDLSRQDEPSILDLANIVQADPSLSAQTLRYARSSLFGFRGNVDTIQDAIARVLGFDMTMNMALGIAVGKQFRNPVDGPLGLNAFWQHSVACATLTQRLARLIPLEHRPKPSMAYLTGLLHNFGFLLLGHMFQPEFYLLNKLVASHPDTPVTELEHQVIGMGQARDVIDMGHAQLGAWLMEAWHLPDEVTITVREHHSDNYQGEHAIFVKLVKIANHLLKRVDIGDEADGELPLQNLLDLGLDEATVLDDFTSLIETEFEDVEAIAKQMAA